MKQAPSSSPEPQLETHSLEIDQDVSEPRLPVVWASAPGWLSQCSNVPCSEPLLAVMSFVCIRELLLYFVSVCRTVVLVSLFGVRVRVLYS